MRCCDLAVPIAVAHSLTNVLSDICATAVVPEFSIFIWPVDVWASRKSIPELVVADPICRFPDPELKKMLEELIVVLN